MLNINKKAFTLVELIVVITILAILGTIGFISLQGYSSEARDSKRVTDLGQIRTGIQVYQAKEGVVPEPSETKTIIGSGTTNLIIQGYAGTGTLRSIKVNTDAKDPLENNYYTYSTNGAKTKFQLLALLENNNTAYNAIPTTYANYETRDLYSVGDKLGILLDSTTNTPVQELGETEVDLSNNTTEYKAIFSKSDIQTLSGISLYNEIVSRSNDNGVIIVDQEENNFISIIDQYNLKHTCGGKTTLSGNNEGSLGLGHTSSCSWSSWRGNTNTILFHCSIGGSWSEGKVLKVQNIAGSLGGTRNDSYPSGSWELIDINNNDKLLYNGTGLLTQWSNTSSSNNSYMQGYPVDSGKWIIGYGQQIHPPSSNSRESNAAYDCLTWKIYY